MRQNADQKPAAGLRGLKVLDFTWAGAGPFAAQILGLMGADVVKVESSARPDLLRIADIAYGWGQGSIDASTCFNDMNAGKRSIELDLKHPQGRAVALRLAARADVICDNMRPGKMEALGMGFDAIRKINPGVVCASVSATGRLSGGEPADVPGYAPVFWAEGGAAAVTGFSDGEPAYLRAPVDMNAGAFAALGMLAALYARQRSGEGAYVDCSAIETVTALVGDRLLAASLGQPTAGRRGNDREPFAPNDVFPCAEPDSWIAISVFDVDQWRALCRVLDCDLLAADPALRSRLARWQRRAEIYDALATATRRCPVPVLEAGLLAAGVPAARCNPISVLLQHPALLERGFWKDVDHPLIGRQRIGSLAFRTQPPLADPPRGGPLLGEHGSEVLEDWLGLSPLDVASLAEAGALKLATIEQET